MKSPNDLPVFLLDIVNFNFLIFVDPYHKQVYQQSLTNNKIQGLPLPKMDFPTSIDIDSHGRVYWIDLTMRAIFSSPKLLLEDTDPSEKGVQLRQIPYGRCIFAK